MRRSAPTPDVPPPGPAGPEPAEDRPPPSSAPDRAARPASPAGYYLYGVVRARSWRPARRSEGGILRVRFRDLEALVRAIPYEQPALERDDIRAHHRLVERVFRRSTVLPAPPGVVFRGRRALIRFLENQYLALDEGLAFLEGHWEVRVHIGAADGGEPGVELADLAMHLYAELRRFAKAAVPLPKGEHRLLTAAFLVERTAWIEFVERADDLAAAHPELAVDVTGPWPPYDFVKLVG